MNTPEWLKPGVYGALIGAAFVGIVGFSWGGWVTDGGVVTLTRRACKLACRSLIKRRLPQISTPRMLLADGSGW